MITLARLLNSNLITCTSYIQLCYEDSGGKHVIFCKLSDLKNDVRFAKFKPYYVSNINLDTFALTLTLNEERYL